MKRHQIAVSFLILSALWGLSFVASRAAVQYVPPVLLAALRFDIAGLFMLGYAFVTTERWRPYTRMEWIVVSLGGTFFIALHHAFLYAGQQYVTSAISSSVISFDPILAAAFAYVLLPDKRLSMIGFAGLGFGILGVGIIARPGPNQLITADMLGVLLVVLSAAAFALGTVLTERLRTNLPVQSMQAWMMLLGAPMLHVTSLLTPTETIVSVQWTGTALLALAYLAFVAGGLGYLLYFQLLDQIGSVEINLVGYTAPIFAAAGGWLLLGERLGVETIVGFCSIVIGFVLVKRDALRAALTGVCWTGSS